MRPEDRRNWKRACIRRVQTSRLCRRSRASSIISDLSFDCTDVVILLTLTLGAASWPCGFKSAAMLLGCMEGAVVPVSYAHYRQRILNVYQRLLELTF